MEGKRTLLFREGCDICDGPPHFKVFIVERIRFSIDVHRVICRIIYPARSLAKSNPKKKLVVMDDDFHSLTMSGSFLFDRNPIIHIQQRSRYS